VFTRAIHWPLTLSQINQSIPLYPVSSRFVLILSSNLRLCLRCGVFPYGFPTKSLYALLLSPIKHCPNYLIDFGQNRCDRPTMQFSGQLNFDFVSHILWDVLAKELNTFLLQSFFPKSFRKTFP
jgi:hypothetical protein